MPGADTSHRRPSITLGVTQLVHHLRHALHIQDIRQAPGPPSAPSTRPLSDRHRPLIPQEQQEAPTLNSSCELVGVLEKGEYTEPRPAEIKTRRSSMMAEADGGSKKRLSEEGTELMTSGRHVRRSQSEQQFSQVHQVQMCGKDDFPTTSPMADLMRPLPAPPLEVTSPSVVHSIPSTPILLDDTADRFITLTETTSSQTPPEYACWSWNSALTAILASPNVDISVSAAVRSRAPNYQTSSDADGEEQVDMRAVRVVPNFSYPLASARWYGSWDDADPPKPLKRRRPSCSVGDDMGSLFPDPSLVPKRLRLKGEKATDASSELGRVLDPDQVRMYRQIMRHNPTFTNPFEGGGE
ncbi:hypothetical protein E8E13_007532 [Curvularia kusanoi]|uniref:Uncharacterized protein n=1 Tax=Curvularia kusanoi TaxID=90978 RepID=A0A9P4TE70_CURKU|nr:hypothetical protein E8E13_007532 [Curvularia kusanoi]